MNLNPRNYLKLILLTSLVFAGTVNAGNRNDRSSHSRPFVEIQKQFEDMQAQIDSLVGQVGSLEEQVTAKEDVITALEVQNVIYNAKITALNSIISSHTVGLSNLQTQVNFNNVAIAAMEDQPGSSFTKFTVTKSVAVPGFYREYDVPYHCGARREDTCYKDVDITPEATIVATCPVGSVLLGGSGDNPDNVNKFVSRSTVTDDHPANSWISSGQASSPNDATIYAEAICLSFEQID